MSTHERWLEELWDEEDRLAAAAEELEATEERKAAERKATEERKAALSGVWLDLRAPCCPCSLSKNARP